MNAVGVHNYFHLPLLENYQTSTLSLQNQNIKQELNKAEKKMVCVCVCSLHAQAYLGRKENYSKKILFCFLPKHVYM